MSGLSGDSLPLGGQAGDVPVWNPTTQRWETAQRFTICTSSTRPGTPLVGQQVFETDTNRWVIWNGSVWQELLDLDTWPPVGAGPAFRAIQSTTEQIATGTNLSPVTVLTDGAGLCYDKGGYFASSAYTPLFPGVYHFAGYISFTNLGGAGVRYHIGLLLNDSEVDRYPQHSATASDVGAHIAMDLALNGVNDDVKLGVAQESGVARTLSKAGLSGHWVRPL